MGNGRHKATIGSVVGRGVWAIIRQKVMDAEKAREKRKYVGTVFVPFYDPQI